MPITVDKVTCAYLKTTYVGQYIPVIRAQISGYSGSYSTDDLKQIWQEIFDRAVGFTATCSVWFHATINLWQKLPASGDYTFGTSVGFKIYEKVDARQQGSAPVRKTTLVSMAQSLPNNYGLYFNDTRICQARVYTGYGNYEYNFLCIFTDSNLNLLTNTYSGSGAIDCRLTAELDDYDYPWDMTQTGISLAKITSSAQLQFRGGSQTISFGEAAPANTWLPYLAYEIEDPYDPYPTIPTTEPDPEVIIPEYDPESQPTPSQLPPPINMTDCGFVRIYNPTLAQLRDLAAYLFTDANLAQTLWNKLKQFVEDPMDAFISLSIVPCTIADGGTEEFSVCFIPTGKYLTKAGEQYVTVDCGSLKIPRSYGSAVDYSPYTKASIYLPFIGTQMLDVDDIMGKTLNVKYVIDIATGCCVASILVDGNVHYQYSGTCSLQIPFSAADFTGIISAIISTGKAIAGGVAGAAGAVMQAVRPESPDQSTGDANTSPNEENGTKSNTKAKFGHIATSTIANTIDSVMGSKIVVEHTSSFNGMSGFLSLRYPYVILEIPRVANPDKYGKYNGRPGLYHANLGSLHGYTVVQEVQLTGIPATNPELDEIGMFLKGGVIL